MAREKLDVLVVGGGGREHALVKSLAKSSRIGRLLAAPGNAGIAADAQTVPVGVGDLSDLVALVEREQIDLTVVGPEAPLVAGLADQLRDRDLAVFGPGAEGARLEGSKAFAKEVMEAAGVPTGQAATFRNHEGALSYLRDQGVPTVIKADGLAAGKGVIVAQTLEEAEEALAKCFLDRSFGEAADTVLIEEYLEGQEISLLAIVSGDQILPLAPAQDYKRIFDDDRGPNTGGMGSYSPVPVVDDQLYRRLVNEVLTPTVRELARRKMDFRGVLYAGLMLTADGPKVLEFNCRFGDPETQALLPRLDSDLLELLATAAEGGKLPPSVKWRAGAAVGVVMASRGYPASSSKGDVIRGLDVAESHEGVEVFHAATSRSEQDLVTAGGRVLTVTGLGDTYAQARARAYRAVAEIDFQGEQHRSDIALRAEQWERGGHGG